MSNRFIEVFRRISSKEQLYFLERLSFLLKAHIPLLKSLIILEKQGKSVHMKELLRNVIEEISNGQSFYKSLERHSSTFGTFTINMIRVGEQSGNLAKNLEYLSMYQKKRHIFQQKIKGALIYPIFIVIATLLIAFFLVGFIFPKILPIFKSMRLELPLSTRMIIFGSDFLHHFGIIIFILFLSFAFLFRYQMNKNERFRYAIQRRIISIPFFGELVRKIQTADICRTLGLLLKSGIPIYDSLSLTSSIVSNLVYKEACFIIAQGVRRGESLSKSFEMNPALFSDIAFQMISIGESTGCLEETLSYLSELYEGEIEEISKNLGSIIEPALMIFIGLIIGFVAISIITPIYAITQNIHH